MAQTVASMNSVMKEVWTSDTLIKQFENENSPLKRIKSVKGKMIGKQAQVPIHTGRGSGYATLGAAGGSLNPAGAQPVNVATYTVPYHWTPIEIETAALAQTDSKDASVAKAKDLEIEGAIENTEHQIVRQLLTNGDGYVAHCATGGASATVSLTPAASEGAAWGYSALQRGWLDVGQPVDIGTSADSDSLVSGEVITAVSKSAASPSITVSTSISTTAGTHFVSIPNPNSATARNPEMNGLRQIINTTGALGGLNPATAGQEFWQAGDRDTTTTVLSLDLLLSLERAVKQNGGKNLALWFGLKQQQNLYSLLQGQIRFTSDGNLSAGAVDSVKWGDKSLDTFADVLDTDVFMVSLDHLFKVTTPGIPEPKWVSDIEGSNSAGLWKQGYTSFGDAVVWPLNIGIERRNVHAAATALQ